MSSCWWQITIQCCRTCYVMNDTKNAVCNLSTFPVVIIYCWKAYWFLRLFPTVLIFQPFMPKYTSESNSEGGRGKWYMYSILLTSAPLIVSEASCKRMCEWTGKPRGALASPLAWLPATPPNGELTHRLQVFMNPYRLYCVFWKCFNKWWLGL